METIKDPIKPQLILFDYGHTLLSEPGWDPMKGLRALLEYADRRCSEEEIQHIYAVGSEYYDTVIMPVKEQGGDIPWKTAARLVLGSCGVGLTISPDEAEDIYWNAETCGAVMPGADEMLDAITSLGIRYGVVSNLTMSGEALERRIRRVNPSCRARARRDLKRYRRKKAEPDDIRLRAEPLRRECGAYMVLRRQSAGGCRGLLRCRYVSGMV